MSLLFSLNVVDYSKFKVQLSLYLLDAFAKHFCTC